MDGGRRFRLSLAALARLFGSFFNVLNISALTENGHVFESAHEQEVLPKIEVSAVGVPPPYFKGGAEKAADG
ncbi:MAG: hypothetical protein JJT96_13045 [Opitutales bacterium]|nr:hypothetical protein [Opitutales bacterium]